MNIYLLVEGRSEVQLYDTWLSYMLPQLNRVDYFQDAKSNNFYLFNGGGIPSIYRFISNAIRDINKSGNYNYFIVALDAEGISVKRRMDKIHDFLQVENISLQGNCQMEIIVHDCCIETWFLGNKKIVKREPEGELFREYLSHYNVVFNDPELMEKIKDFSSTKAIFHGKYLREMLKEHRIPYSKTRLGEVLKKYYFDQLLDRIKKDPSHLKSLSKAIDLFSQISKKITQKKS